MFLEGKGESFVPQYVDLAKMLKDNGCDKVCMCCNTAHYAIDEIASASDANFINLLDVEKNKISILHKLQPFGIKRFFFCIRIGTGIKSCVNSCCLCLTEKFCQKINLEKRFSSTHSDSTFVTPVILIAKSLFQKLRRGVLLPLSHFPGVRIMAELAAHCTSTQEYHISDARSVY